MCLFVMSQIDTFRILFDIESYQGGDYMSDKQNANEKENTKEEVSKMIRSMATVPLLKDETAAALFKSLKKSQLKPYTENQKKETDKKIAEVISKGLMK